jgi:CPA2 family monovalent cation:H+ antiporter-2
VLLGWARQRCCWAVTYLVVRSSPLLSDLDRLGNRETPVILSILVIEDRDGGPCPHRGPAGRRLAPEGTLHRVALLVVAGLCGARGAPGSVVQLRPVVRAAVADGARLTPAGRRAGGEVQVSAAVGAFPARRESGQIAERPEPLVPIRDVFGLFFVFGLDDPAMPPAGPGWPGVVTGASKAGNWLVGCK